MNPGTPSSIKLQHLLLDNNDSVIIGGVKKTTIKKEAVKEGNYLNGSFITENEVTEVVIDDQARVVEKTFKNDKTGLDETKSLVEVNCVANDENKTRVLWTMNKTSRNLIVDVLGEDEVKWIGKIIPVVVDASLGKAAVYPNRVLFQKLHGTKQKELL
tara:strand:- start:619 stop:1092 length:474 start_codon:yes stop_codon:yes gene_type:complete